MNETDIEVGSMEDFALRFDDLQREAMAFGFHSIIGLVNFDALDFEDDIFINGIGSHTILHGLASKIIGTTI
jgi:hypothetical protein